MAATIKPPAIPAGSADVQVQTLYRYLYQLSEQLNVELDNASSSGVAVLEAALMPSAALEKNAPKGSVEAYNQLKALIVKTAAEVEASTRSIVFDMTDEYRAQSEYGTYSEYLNNQISIGADGILMDWSAENGITTPVGDFGEYKAESRAYMQIGIVQYNRDGTVEAGMVIGKDLQRVTVDGKELVRSGNIYCLLKADSLSFWQNGAKLAEYGLYEFFAERAYIGEVYTDFLSAGSDFGAKLVVKDDVIEAVSKTIKLTADKINAVANDIDLSGNTTIKLMVAGGVNLLKDSAKGAGGTGYPLVTYDLSETIADGETLTVTIWDAKLGSGKTHWALYDGGGMYLLSTLTEVSAGVYSATFTYKASGNTGRVALYPMPRDVTATSSVGKAKLERGNRSTSWTASPLDPANAVKAGTTVEITEERFRVESPSSEFAVPGAEQGEETVRITGEGIFAQKILGPVLQTIEGGEYYVGASGDYATLSDAFSAINDKHLNGDVVLKLLDSSDPGGTLNNVSGGKVIITPVNLINSAITAPITNESATLYSMGDNGFYLKPASAGSLRRSIFEIGHVGAMGVRGKRITFRCRMYSASADTPAYPHVRIYCGESYSVSRHIASLTRTDTSNPTSWLEYAITFTVPVDAREDDILWMRFHASADNQPVDAAATAYFRSTIMEIGDAVNSGGIRTFITSITSLAVRNCSSRVCLHGVSIGDAGLTAENSTVSVNRSTFNGAHGFSLWGGSGAVYNCYGTCTKAADARGGGAIEIFGLAPTGTKSGLLDTTRMATSAPPAVDVPDITTKTVEITAKATGTYSGSSWWSSDAAMRQGWTETNHTLRGAVIFDLSSLSGKTVSKAVLRIKRVEGYGKGGDVDVRIYRTNITSLSGAPAKYNDAFADGKMAPGETRSFDVTNILRRDNLTKAFVLQADDSSVMSGKTYSTNYARFAGTGNEKNAPMLTVTYE